MNNLNKFTKAELISKFKELKQNNSNLNQNSILILINSYLNKLILLKTDNLLFTL